jgi:hypothetical protein
LTSKTVPPRGEPRRANRWLAFGLITLGGGLVANSLLGPLIGDVIRYRFSETLLNQGIGLDAASLFLVAPLSVGAGILVLRGHPAGPVLALGPAIYAAYMSVQYAVGPEYLVLAGNNERFFPFHLGLFVLAIVVAVGAWAEVDPQDLPPVSRRAARWSGGVLLALGALLFLRYLPGLIDLMGGEPSVPEYLENPTTFFLIALMDLGVFLPAAVGAGIALRGEAPWARKAMYGIVAWFALVGVAVAAMTITMQVNDDPAASVGQTATFVVAAVVFVALALRVHWPLFGRRRGPRVGRPPMAT